MFKIFLYIIYLFIITFHSVLYSKTLIKNSIIINKKQYHICKNIPLKTLKLSYKKGTYTIASIFSNKEELDWIKKFNIVELGNIENKNITYQLLKKKHILTIPHRIAYDWMPAFYYYTDKKNNNFVNWLYKNKKTRTLNPKGPYIHCIENRYNWCQDYYYNLGNKKVFEHKIDFLINNMKNKGFNGIFFDWASGSYILEKKYKSIYDYYKKLNPHKDYFKLIENFYKTLKNKNIFIVTNQAFRKKKYLLKYTTYDMTESYITTNIYKNIKIQLVEKGWIDKIETTNYYPIYKNSQTIKDSLHFINLLTLYKKKYKKYGFKNFIYINYAAPQYKKIYDSTSLYETIKPKNAIYFNYAMAKLTNNIVYTEIPRYRNLERDDIYFYNLGRPLGKRYQKLTTINGYIRFYSKGFVLVSPAHKTTRYIKIFSKYIPKNRYIFNSYNKIWLKSKQNILSIKLSYIKDTFSKKILPLGRVYLYNQN